MAKHTAGGTDMGIEDPELVELVNQIEELEKELFAHPLHTITPHGPIESIFFYVVLANKIIFIVQSAVLSRHGSSTEQIKCFQRKAEVNREIQLLKSKMRDSQLQKFRDELKNRSRVLKKLGHIDADGIVQLKGRAACLIDTGDELLVMELMFNGMFNDLDPDQVVALASCFIPGDRSNEQIHLRA
ncbi:hypothetical protein IFM89_039089 [Coptis chinensis]|uniref:ATP-dependent RNA helicase Ski2/MTR4 C-terminal domain-containing protein n=1 Tax=Coptis chinensis TaxID=261450 RepID=A0A835IF82_9MAGN|nr:hypothetical protein IFM89_039089 [Coptis chinensis]